MAQRDAAIVVVEIAEGYHLNAHPASAGLIATSLAVDGVDAMIDTRPANRGKFAFADESDPRLRKLGCARFISVRPRRQLTLRLNISGLPDDSCLPQRRASLKFLRRDLKQIRTAKNAANERRPRQLFAFSACFAAICLAWFLERLITWPKRGRTATSCVRSGRLRGIPRRARQVGLSNTKTSSRSSPSADVSAENLKKRSEATEGPRRRRQAVRRLEGDCSRRCREIDAVDTACRIICSPAILTQQRGEAHSSAKKPMCMSPLRRIRSQQR